VSRMDAAVAARAVLRSVIAAALAVDAVIHLQLAGAYDNAAPAGIGEGNLFRIEAAFALAAAVAVLLPAVLLPAGLLPAGLLPAGRFTVPFAALVLGAGLAAVLVYRYVDVPALGPIPAMYEPVWFTKKSVVAIAEAVGLVSCGGPALAGARRDRTG